MLRDEDSLCGGYASTAGEAIIEINFGLCKGVFLTKVVCGHIRAIFTDGDRFGFANEFRYLYWFYTLL